MTSHDALLMLSWQSLGMRSQYHGFIVKENKQVSFRTLSPLVNFLRPRNLLKRWAMGVQGVLARYEWWSWRHSRRMVVVMNIRRLVICLNQYTWIDEPILFIRLCRARALLLLVH